MGRVKAGHIIVSGELMPVKLIVKKASSIGEKSKYTGYNSHATHTHKEQIVYIEAKRQYEVLLD
jgi:hypothetical protein